MKRGTMYVSRLPGRGGRLLARVGRAGTWAAIILFLWIAAPAEAEEEAERYFEAHVRPILAEHCLDCHGAKKQESGLRLDSRQALLAGGDRGPALAPGDPDASLLIQAVRHVEDLEMPPGKKLTDPQVQTLTSWVAAGAYWPESALPAAPAADAAATHWAFQPVQPTSPPPVDDTAWVRSPIDAFLLARLQQAGLRPAPEADRRTLIRRAYYATTGLPPSAAEVQSFVSNDDPHAYPRLVDRLLASPHFGEHWARHWLDVARYSDTKGYVYDREERFWVHAWSYRDWVIRAINENMPYDRFLLLQIAADQVDDRRPEDLAAMGFLTVGRRFLGVRRDIIDDRIDVVTRGTMGLTVSCARCHDHKYDPIPTADYYSLYGVFDSSIERLLPASSVTDGDGPFWQELRQRQEKLESALQAARQEASDRVRARIADYLFAQTELHKYPADGFDQIFEKSDLLPAVVRRWEAWLRNAKARQDPVFAAWHAYAKLPEDKFAQQAASILPQLRCPGEIPFHPAIEQAFADAPTSMREVCDRYGKLLAEIDSRWQTLQQRAVAEGVSPPQAMPAPADEMLRQILYGATSPCQVPHEPIVHIEGFFDTSTCTNLWKLQSEVDRWLIQSDAPVRYALAMVDRPIPVEPHIFVRGNPLRLGRQVPRQFLSALAGQQRQPFQHGSGRLELAQAIIDPGNPLTARVAVNRVWMHYFGTGLVSTPSDFGLRADPPSHPELLDWLASQLIQNDWNLKWLHRTILLSSTFRQASRDLDPDRTAAAQGVDPANRLLWRMSPRRLSFEAFRDSLLVASGELDRQLFGKPIELFKSPQANRRTIYGLIDRQFLPSTLRIFDFANPDLHVPQRSQTTVPQQALFFLNDPQLLQRARKLAAVVADQPDAAARLDLLFQRTLQRSPTSSEIADAQRWLATASRSQKADQLLPWEQLAQVLLCTNEFLFVD